MQSSIDPIVMENNIANQEQSLGFHIKVTKEALNMLFDRLLDVNLQDIDLEVNAIELHLQRIKKGGQVNIEENKLHIDLPLAIQIRRQSGLFSVEGAGEIMLHLISEIKFGPGGVMVPHTFINDHDWLEKPKLQLGALNMSVSTLVTMLIDHSGSIITGKLDKVIKENFNLAEFLNALIAEHLGKIKMVQHEEIVIKPRISGIDLIPVSLQDDTYLLSGLCHATIHFIRPGQKHQFPPSIVQWVDQLPDHYVFTVDAELPYALLSQIFENTVKDLDVGGKKIEINTVDLEYNGNLYADISLSKPVEADIHISATPIYHKESSNFTLKDIEVKSKFYHFIYKAISSFVNTSIKSGVEEKLPIQVSELLYESMVKLVQKINQDYTFVHASMNNAEIGNLTFLSEYILASFKLHKTDLTLSIGKEEVKEFSTST